MPDRYADAVRGRRAELRAQRLLLAGGHRAEIRTSLALTRLTLTAEVSTALAELGREIRVHVDRAGRAGRRRLPVLLVGALDCVEANIGHRLIALALPPLRRIAAERSVPADDLPLRITPSGGRIGVSAGVPRPDPPAGAARALLLAGASGGAGAWRLGVLSAVGLPVLGLPALGGPAVLPLAAGLGLAALAATVWARRVALDRARLGRWAAEALAVARAGLEAELGRRLLDLEQRAGAALDAAVARRRAEVDAELRALAPGVDARAAR
ncbi:hypothetical protein [Pseudonocardia acidicola]|uniref:Uncharacterized protein n=1 Tax=Pseudonocardia acidicola TaxID=2724939 RepID=A0ABX1SFE1_9PSEU|nr:hypothetical protein [Pseudonocardia acidicola]NMH98974.1 hypothetical protein [Pseudonocardia acidicola]